MKNNIIAACSAGLLSIALSLLLVQAGCGDMESKANAKTASPSAEESDPSLASKPIKSYFFDEKTSTNRAWHRKYFIDEVEISGHRYLVLYDYGSAHVITMIPAKE